MNDNNLKIDFDSLYNQALAEWPEIVEIKNIVLCGEETYCLAEGVSEFLDSVVEKSANGPAGMLMLHLQWVFTVFFHRLARHCIKIRPSEIRKDDIRARFNLAMQDVIKDWECEEGKSSHEDDYKLAMKYLEGEGIADLTDKAAMQIKPHETSLQGLWFRNEKGYPQKDDNFKRITWLILNSLEKIKRLNLDYTLYRDPADGRFWEKTFPNYPDQSFTPLLTCITKEQALDKYGPDGIE